MVIATEDVDIITIPCVGQIMSNMTINASLRSLTAKLEELCLFATMVNAEI